MARGVEQGRQFRGLHPGWLLVRQITNRPLTVMALVGIILLIGIIKKNSISSRHRCGLARLMPVAAKRIRR